MLPDVFHQAGGFLPGLWLACLLDLLLGDPRWLPHPVILIAALARRLETFFNGRQTSAARAGQYTVIVTLLVVSAMGVSLLSFLQYLSPVLCTAASIVLLYTTLALRGLAAHALAVFRALEAGESSGDLDPARTSVGMIVGRNTSELDRAGIVRACVESVAENMSDGVIAPLLYAVVGALIGYIFGWGACSLGCAAVTALLYKTVNTMDSMFGYTNEQYLHFGRTAALLDDAVNSIPARLSSLALIVGAFFVRDRKSGVRAWKTVLRDRKKHASPNAGYPEAAMAGALGLQLGGNALYFGKVVTKPTLGDSIQIPEKEHIKAAVNLMVFSSLFSVFVFSLSCFVIIYL